MTLRIRALMRSHACVSTACGAQVLQALTRKFTLTEDVDLGKLAALLPPQATGADAYGLCADAWLQALRRRIQELTDAGRVQVGAHSNFVGFTGSPRSTRRMRPGISLACA